MTQVAQPTTWPQSLPTPNEPYFLSVSCNSSSNHILHWAFHGGQEEPSQYSPALFWITPTISGKELEEIEKDSDAGAVYLSSHLPELVHAYIFGETNAATSKNAQTTSMSRDTDAQKLRIYIVSSNVPQIELLSNVLHCIPSKLHILQPDDFFSDLQKQMLPTDMMTIDRLATLRGAAHLYGFPAFVMDAEKIVTYMAADGNGHIMGGSISPGIFMRLNALQDYYEKGSWNDNDGSVPKISVEEFHDVINTAIQERQPLPTFARTTKHAMICSVLNELSSTTRTMVKQWKYKVDRSLVSPKKTNTNDVLDIFNSDRTVIMTGNSAEVMTHLLKPNCGNIIEVSAKRVIQHKKDNCKVVCTRNLSHFGITAVLMKQSNNHLYSPGKRPPTPAPLPFVVFDKHKICIF